MEDFSFKYTYSDKAILQKIGRFIQSKRIAMQLTQDELAEKATMSRSTLSLLERGDGISLANLLKILRILDAFYVLDKFELEPKISPMQLAKEAQQEYHRVRKKTDHSSDDFEYEW